MNENENQLILLKKIKKLETDIQNDLKNIKDTESLKKIEVKYNGKNSNISILLKHIKKHSLETKKKIGKEINLLKKKLFFWIQEQKKK